MKWSKYNIIFVQDKKWLLYNSASNIFAEMDEELYNVVMDIKKSPDTYNFSSDYKELKEQLVNSSVLVEDEEDVFRTIKLNTHRSRFNQENLCLTILPTLDCNFRCPYCFETEHEHSYMTFEVMDAIVKYVKHLDSLKTVFISWMGGEPLLAINSIEYITRKIRELRINIQANIVTNGYLLDNEMASRLVRMGIVSAQVTIDGLKNKHDQRRVLAQKGSTFDRIIDNLKVVLEKENSLNLTIRVNIDKDNQEEFAYLHQYLIEQLGDKVFIYPGFIEESPYGCSKNLCALNRKEKVDFYLNKIPPKKHFPFFYPSNNGGECMTARNINSFVIGPKGELYKCWECIGKEEMIIGNIVTNKITNSKLYSLFLNGADFLEDDKCRNCSILPICFGGCVIRRIERDYYNKNIDFCSIFKGNLPRFLTLHYKIKQG